MCDLMCDVTSFRALRCDIGKVSINILTKNEGV